MKLSQELLNRLHLAAWALSGSVHDAEDPGAGDPGGVLARPRRLRRCDPGPYLMRALRNTYVTGVRKASRRPRTGEAARPLDVREPTIGTRVFRARERLALALTAGAADA